MSPGGAACQIVLFIVFFKQAVFKDGATFNQWNNSAI